MLHIEERILVSEVAKLRKEKEEAQAKSAAQRENAKTSQTATTAGTATSSLEGANDVVTEHPAATSQDTPPPPIGIDDASIAPQVAPTAFASHTPIQSPLYAKELLIIQQLIRHGEKVMYIDEDNKKEVTVAEYVASDLGIDELAFTTPLFNEILQELLQHLGQPDFTAEHHFIAHANPALSRLAVDLIEEKYQLSKYHSKTQTILSDADRLTDIIPHLMTDYKHSLIEIELKETLNQLRQPDVMADPDKCVETMVRYKELMEIKQQMAKHLGDRVIG